jgi:hypothetical protein
MQSIQSFDAHNPPTPQSPIYMQEHHGEVGGGSPMSTVPRTIENDFDTTPTATGHPRMSGNMDGLRIVCSTPTSGQVFSTGEALQNSPGSLSSCSSVASNGHSQEYFYRNAQQAGAPQYHVPTTAVAQSPQQIAYPHQMAAPMNAAHNIHVHANAQPMQQQVHVPAPHAPQSQMWYDAIPYQQPVMLPPSQHPPRTQLYYTTGMPTQDWGFVKAEEDPSMMLPTPRAALY